MKENYKESVAKEKLAESRKERERLLAKWGFEPVSMMYIQKIHDSTLDVLVEDTLAEGSYPRSNFNIRNGALPQSPTKIIKRLLKFYTEPGDIVLNPMCERLPHLLIANYLKRNAIGQDICERFYRHDVEKVKRRLLAAQFLDPEGNQITKEDENHFFTIFNGLTFNLTKDDSRHLVLPNNSIDHITTSPPYWNLGIYGDEPEQVGSGTKTGHGDAPTYEEFLVGLGEIFQECFRVLKKNKFMCVQVNDFRKGGKFYNYHGDLIKLLESIGFTLWDIIIYNTSTHPLAAIFVTQLRDRMMFAKNHEYNLTFKRI